MDTPYTLRATHLKDLYETITMKTLAKDERLDILLTLKATVRVRNIEGQRNGIKYTEKFILSSLFILLFLQEHDCKLTREIVELVDREADLLVRDTKPSALMGMSFSIVCLSNHLCIRFEEEDCYIIPSIL